MSSDVFSASVKDGISQALREVGHVSMDQDVKPAMKHAMSLVENMLKAHITENEKGYNLARHAQRGVKSRVWTLTTSSKTFGFTTFLNAREWLYIFNDGNYKSIPRKTKKAYKTQPYTDKRGRHVPAREYQPGVSRGNVVALQFLDSTRKAVEGSIFSILRHDIERAVTTRIQQL